MPLSKKLRRMNFMSKKAGSVIFCLFLLIPLTMHNARSGLRGDKDSSAVDTAARGVKSYQYPQEPGRRNPLLQPNFEPAKNTRIEGTFGEQSFQISSTQYTSWWHDIPYKPVASEEHNIIHFVTEIPLHMTGKMELQKRYKHNPIAQDRNSDGSLRYYSYGTPFFNYGFVPQTWENPSSKSSQGYSSGDNDPLDVMEFGAIPLPMGSLHPCRVLGCLELVDQGEIDHKIICVVLKNTGNNPMDQNTVNIHTLEDLEMWKPGVMDQLRDWLKRYKTSDGKPENTLASDTPKSVEEAMEIIEETHNHWKSLCGHDGTELELSEKMEDFWLDSPGCRGTT